MNSFIHPANQVAFGEYKPEDVKEALDTTEKIAKKRLRAIAKMPTAMRTLENTVLAFCRATEDFDTICHLVSHHESVIGEPWREADLLMSRRANKLNTQIFMDKTLYQALKEVAPSKATHIRLHDDLLRAYRRSGIELSEADQKIMKRLSRELNDALTRFSQNATKASDEAFLPIANEAQLKGMDDEFIAQCKKSAEAKGLDGLVIDHDEPTYAKVMSQCSVRRTRQKYYKLVFSRGKRYNARLTKKILHLRHEMAALLGFAHFGDYIAETRMAKKAATARAFIDDLTSRYKTRAWQEFEELQTFARTLEKKPKLELDITEIDTGLDWYYAAKLRENQFSISEDELKSFFPITSVLDGMFSTLSTLYGVRFERIETSTWHKDVEVYAIYSEADAHIATVWCDWFARKGKRGGAWMHEYHVAERADGKVDEPHLGYVCANINAPTKTKPALLTFRDVETIWHEFGHFMHLALSATELPEQSMTGCLWDFVEAPSQIMENWVWQPEILHTFAKHYKTGEKLPESILEKLKAARTFRVASKTMRQLYLGTVDLALHTEFDTTGNADPIAFSQKVKAEFYPAKVATFDANITTFTHIFAGGYAAGYYSYKWAEAIESDLFSRFEKEGILNPTTGHAYAKEILARGDEIDPSELIHNFLGRASSPAAMLRRDGIADN